MRTYFVSYLVLTLGFSGFAYGCGGTDGSESVDESEGSGVSVESESSGDPDLSGGSSDDTPCSNSDYELRGRVDLTQYPYEDAYNMWTQMRCVDVERYDEQEWEVRNENEHCEVRVMGSRLTYMGRHTSAGTLRAAGGTEEMIELEPGDQTLVEQKPHEVRVPTFVSYDWFSSEGEFWDGSQTIEIGAPGGDIPRFKVSATPPVDVNMKSSSEIYWDKENQFWFDASSDMVLRWETDGLEGNEVFRAEFHRGLDALECSWEASSGEGTIPASMLGSFESGGTDGAEEGAWYRFSVGNRSTVETKYGDLTVWMGQGVPPADGRGSFGKPSFKVEE